MSLYSVIISIESLIRVSNQPYNLNKQNFMLKAGCQTTQKTELLLTSCQSMDWLKGCQHRHLRLV